LVFPLRPSKQSRDADDHIRERLDAIFNLKHPLARLWEATEGGVGIWDRLSLGESAP
jgi:hypothetical protein